MSVRPVRALFPLLMVGACSFPEFRVEGGGALSESCRNGLRDGDELNVDCGPSCAPCPKCANGLKDDDEDGVDCGGICGVCATCTDGTQNGSEGDVDCGGTCAERCDTDQRCKVAVDCDSLVCMGLCQASTCLDEIRNGLETGKDCGGPCPGCADGNACVVNEDCSSGRCQDGICVNAGCTDGILNGHESDLDCGGDQCAPCGTGDQCQQDDDCESRLCTAERICSAATCSDTVQNQGESATDCGGPGCPPCGTGATCTKPSDCQSALCQNLLCVPAHPTGQPLSKSKWSIQTSETDTETATSQAFDDDVSSCWSTGKAQYDGMYLQLDLGEPRIFFKILLQVTVEPYDQHYPTTLDVFISNDLTFGDPAASAIGGSQWTWIDFQGAQVGRYIRFEVTEVGPQPWSIGDIAIYE